MTDEQFEKLIKLLENIDWKLWEMHKMIKGVLVSDESESDNDN